VNWTVLPVHKRGNGSVSFPAWLAVKAV